MSFASSKLTTSPRSCWDFNLFLIVFLRFSYELRRNRLPTFKAILKNFNHFAKEVSFSCPKTFNWISFPTAGRSCENLHSFPMVFLRFSYELWGNRLPTFKAFLKNFNRFAKESSFSFLKTFKWISLPAGFQLNDDSVEISIRVPWFFLRFQSLCQRSFLQFS